MFSPNWGCAASSRRLGIAAALLALASSFAVAGRPPGVIAKGGDRLTAQIEAGESDAFAVDLAAGGSLGVTVKGMSPFAPRLRAFDPFGTEVDVAALAKGAGKPTLTLKRLVPGPGKTGAWKIVVEGANATTGVYTALFTAKHPASAKAKAAAVPAAGTFDLTFAADSGAAVGATVTERSGGPIAGATLLAPNGEAVPGGDAFTRKKTKLALKPVPMTAGFGAYVLRVTGGAAGATVDVAVTVKFAKVVKRVATLPAELRVEPFALAAVKQQDEGVAAGVQTTNLAAGTDFEFDDAGLRVHDVVLDGATAAHFAVDVDADTPFGPHRLFAYPPPLLGEPVLVGTTTVAAPEPTLGASSVATIRQEDAGVVLDVTGTGLRAGGTLTVSGAGVAVGPTVVVSPTLVRASLTVASDAAFGPRDVAYAQPAAGGGATAALADAFTVLAPVPVLSAVSQAVVRQGDGAVRLTLTGNRFRNGCTLSVSGSGLALSNGTRLSDTTFSVDVAVAADASFGARDVTFTQPLAAGGAAATLTGALLVKAPLPTISTTSPATVREDDAGVTLTVNGAGFRSGGAVSVGGSGVAVRSTTIVSDTQATATIDVDSYAAFGARDVTYTQPASGGGDSVTSTGALPVKAPIPVITGASPTSLRQGALSATLTLSGTGFRTGGAIAVSGSGLTLGSTTVVNATQATISVTVAGDAAFGARDVTFTQSSAGGGDAVTSVGALALKAPFPALNSVTPSTVKQGDTATTLTVAGIGLRSGGSITISGAGLTLGSTTVVSDTTATVSVTAASDAAPGARDVTFTQPVAGGGDAATRTGGLTVNCPDPTFTLLSPATVTQGQTGVTFTLTGTNFRDSATVALGASDVNVTSYVRNSDTQATVVADVGSSAAVGLRNATYTQPAAGGGASATRINALQVNAPTPTVTSISPTIFKQGQTSQTLTVNGTNFRSGGAVTIAGAGLTLGSTTIVSATQATVSVTVADTATVGARDVTFTQSSAGGGAAGTGAALLTINFPDPTITTVSPAEVGQGGTGTLTVDGTNFRSGFTLTAGSGITLSNLSLVSSTQVTATYSVGTSATLGTRNVVYAQNASGGGASATKTAAINVRSFEPTVTSTSPTVWFPGQASFTVRIVGTGFVSGTTVSASGSGLTITNLSSGSPDTEMALRVSVASNASFGARDVTITPGSTGGPAHTFAGLVTVAPADPAVTSFSHAALAQGATSIAVTIGGQNFASGDTPAASGSGVSFSSVSVASSSQITATVTVSGSAATGSRNLTVSHASSNGARSATLLGAFVVTSASPTVTAANPSAVGVTASGGSTRDVPITITGTNFMTGATLSVSKSGGSGITVKSGSERVVSGTSLAATLTVAPSATTGAWDLQVSNPSSLGNSGSGGNGLLTVNPSTTRTVNNVVASSGTPYGGERVTVYGAGFASGDAVEFGGVRGIASQYLDVNTIVTTVPAPTSPSRTAATAVNVTVRASGGSSATLAGGYVYARDDVSFVVRRSWPAQGATGLPGNLKRAAVLLSAPCDTTTGTHGNVQVFQSGGSTVTSSRAFGPRNRWLVLQRSSSGTLSSANYVISIATSLTSLAGNPLVPVHMVTYSQWEQFTFGVASGTTDSTAPTLSSVTPANGATGVGRSTQVVLVFSEEIDPAAVTTSNITFKQGSTTIPASIDLASDLKTVTITPETSLAANTTYTTTITSGVTDMCANAFSSTSKTFTTGTSDTTAPTIDQVIVEQLPADLDGSGTYVNSSGTSGQAFDVFLPRNGFLLDVRFSDADSGIDPSQFSAKCNAAVGSSSANAELASNFTVTPTGATWRIPSGTDVAAGENVVFTFVVTDMAGNGSASKTITVDVVDRNTAATGSSSTGHSGGDHDPLDSRQTWILRADYDAYTTTYSGSGASSGATTTVAGNNAPDFDEALRYVGLETGSMSTAAAATVNGTSVGTNAIVRNMVLRRIRELLRARYGIAEDGTRGADSVDIEFLIPGEQGSLSSMPTYSSSNSSNSSNAYSEMSIGGTVGAESTATTTTALLGQAWFDARNLRQEQNLNTGTTNQITGIYMLGMFKYEIGDFSGQPFRDKIFDKFTAGFTGATPIGQGSDDDDVLAEAFDRTAGGNTSAQNARYDAIHDAVELVGLYVSAVLSHEIGHSTGLCADGPPKTGLFGGAHYNNTFTEATSTYPNTSDHLDYLGNDIMGASTSVDAAALTGSDFQRFSPLDMAYLLNRLFFDEGR